MWPYSIFLYTLDNKVTKQSLSNWLPSATVIISSLPLTSWPLKITRPNLSNKLHAPKKVHNWLFLPTIYSI